MAMNENSRTLLVFIIIIALATILIRVKNSGTYRTVLSMEITKDEIMEHIRYLSHKDRAGRYPGSRESKDVISYLIRNLKSYGVKPGMENKSYVQPFDFTDNINLGKNNNMVIDGDTLELESDFIPLWFSGNDSISTSAVFAGYGFNINSDEIKWNDYANIDVSGKWVFIMRNSPDRDMQHSLYRPYAGLHKKMLVARDNGAAGVVFISQTEDTGLFPLKYISGYKNGGIPAIHLANKAADKLLKKNGWSRKKIQNTMNESLQSITFEMPNIIIAANVELEPAEIRGGNVVGLIKSGNRRYRDEYIVLGAHFDHIGMGGPGSGSRKPNATEIHYGADDNASGTAGILELAQKLISHKSRLKRSILLVGFDAEEKGLLGAKHFVENPPVALDKIAAMINLDMIGRMKDSTFNIGGVGTSSIFQPLLDSLTSNSDYNVNMTMPGFGPSDHAAFYAEDIPVLFFFSGVHSEYHTPEDTWKLINLEGEKYILEKVHDVVFHLANIPAKPDFKESGPREGEMTRNASFKVTFGIMPAYGSIEEGLEVDGISKIDGPAAKAGIKKGDVIKMINGKPIKDIYEFMDRLRELEKGMTVPVIIERNGKKQELSVSF